MSLDDIKLEAKWSRDILNKIEGEWETDWVMDSSDIKEISDKNAVWTEIDKANRMNVKWMDDLTWFIENISKSKSALESVDAYTGEMKKTIESQMEDAQELWSQLIKNAEEIRIATETLQKLITFNLTTDITDELVNFRWIFTKASGAILWVDYTQDNTKWTTTVSAWFQSVWWATIAGAVTKWPNNTTRTTVGVSNVRGSEEKKRIEQGNLILDSIPKGD